MAFFELKQLIPCLLVTFLSGVLCLALWLIQVLKSNIKGDSTTNTQIKKPGTNLELTFRFEMQRLPTLLLTQLHQGLQHGFTFLKVPAFLPQYLLDNFGITFTPSLC